MGIKYRCLFNRLQNNGMLSVHVPIRIALDEAIRMSTHNIQFHDKIGKFLKTSLNICFLVLLEEFRSDSKTSSNSPW